MDYCGFDLAKTPSQICLRTEDGQLIERRIKTTRVELTRFFAERPRMRILIEAATESEVMAEEMVKHIYTIDDGLIKRMVRVSALSGRVLLVEREGQPSGFILPKQIKRVPHTMKRKWSVLVRKLPV